MTRRSKARAAPETVIAFAGEAKARRQPSSRAPEAVRLRSGVTLSFPTLRRWHGALAKALASPRSASTALSLTDMAADIAALLGPAMDPDHVPEARPIVRGYTLRRPDGTEQHITTSAEAAKLLGLTPNSLRVMLSRGGGEYKRTTDAGTTTLTRKYVKAPRA